MIILIIIKTIIIIIWMKMKIEFIYLSNNLAEINNLNNIYNSTMSPNSYNRLELNNFMGIPILINQILLIIIILNN